MSVTLERMKVSVFLVCYNESVLLPHTIAHYKKYLPNCSITIYDNESDDSSVEIAKSLGCTVVTWPTGGKTDEIKLRDLKNSCWETIHDGWVVMADMDEWLCVTENELHNEYGKGTTILRINGYDMIGESNMLNLSDINLNDINKATPNHYEDKSLCFLRPSIHCMNYHYGAHGCNPTGSIKYSKYRYTNKHMSKPGLPFLIQRMIDRFNRSHAMRVFGMDTHYTDNVNNITNNYILAMKNSIILN